MKKTMKALSQNSWVLPSLCIIGGCIEIQLKEDGVLIRTTGEPEKVVEATKEEWEAFIKSAKAGQYDY